MDENLRQQELGRVFMWFAENPKMVEQIRCEDGVVDTKQAIEVLEKLKADHMECLIPVVLSNMYPDRVMNKVIKRFTAEVISKTIAADGVDAVVQRLIDIARSEIELQ